MLSVSTVTLLSTTYCKINTFLEFRELVSQFPSFFVLLSEVGGFLCREGFGGELGGHGGGQFTAAGGDGFSQSVVVSAGVPVELLPEGFVRFGDLFGQLRDALHAGLNCFIGNFKFLIKFWSMFGL
jgi:hypothetical protein